MTNLLDKLSDFFVDNMATVPFYSDSEFSTHQLIETLLEQSGIAKVRISSFSISEVALRSFARLYDDGLISELQCLLDFTVKRHRLGLLFFASNFITEIGLLKNHSKIILIENDTCKWVVLSSGNLNLNDKIEAGFISRDPYFFDFYSCFFDLKFESSLKITPDEFE
jgi:hypothetical protein